MTYDSLVGDFPSITFFDQDEAKPRWDVAGHQHRLSFCSAWAFHQPKCADDGRP